MNEPMPTGMGVVVRTSVGIAEVIAALWAPHAGTATLAKMKVPGSIRRSLDVAAASSQ